MTKTISVNYDEEEIRINDISENHYEIFLEGASNSGFATEIINNTKTKYLFGLPQRTVYVFYWAYLAIATMLILTVKVNLNYTE